jgi:hypothetical protein
MCFGRCQRDDGADQTEFVGGKLGLEGRPYPLLALFMVQASERRRGHGTEDTASLLDDLESVLDVGIVAT